MKTKRKSNFLFFAFCQRLMCLLEQQCHMEWKNHVLNKYARLFCGGGCDAGGYMLSLVFLFVYFVYCHQLSDVLIDDQSLLFLKYHQQQELLVKHLVLQQHYNNKWHQKQDHVQLLHKNEVVPLKMITMDVILILDVVHQLYVQQNKWELLFLYFVIFAFCWHFDYLLK